MRYRYTLDIGREIGRPGVRGHPYSTHEDFARLSCGLFQVEGGRHGPITHGSSSRIAGMFREPCRMRTISANPGRGR